MHRSDLIMEYLISGLIALQVIAMLGLFGAIVVEIFQGNILVGVLIMGSFVVITMFVKKNFINGL